jgi:hypothetical protein
LKFLFIPMEVLPPRSVHARSTFSGNPKHIILKLFFWMGGEGTFVENFFYSIFSPNWAIISTYFAKLSLSPNSNYIWKGRVSLNFHLSSTPTHQLVFVILPPPQTKRKRKYVKCAGGPFLKIVILIIFGDLADDGLKDEK